MKPEKRFNLWDIEGTTFIEDHKEGSYHIGKTEDVDINSLRNITKRLNIYADENEQLKQQISYYEKLITDKDVEWLRDNTVWEQMPTSKRIVTKTTLSDKND